MAGPSPTGGYQGPGLASPLTVYMDAPDALVHPPGGVEIDPHPGYRQPYTGEHPVPKGRQPYTGERTRPPSHLPPIHYPPGYRGPRY